MWCHISRRGVYETKMSPKKDDGVGGGENKEGGKGKGEGDTGGKEVNDERKGSKSYTLY